MIARTFLNLPSIKLEAIFQKFGRDDSMASVKFFTRSTIACHTGSPEDLACQRVRYLFAEKAVVSHSIPMIASACLDSTAATDICNSDVRV